MNDRDSSGRQRHRRPWSEDDDRDLRQMIEARESVAHIASTLQRTQDAIRGRAAQFKLILPSALRPWSRHWRLRAGNASPATHPQKTQSGDPASDDGGK